MPQPACLFVLPFFHLGVGRLARDLAGAWIAAGGRAWAITCGAAGALGDDPAMVAEARDAGLSFAHADVFGRAPSVMAAARGAAGALVAAEGVDVAHAFTAVAAEAVRPHLPVMATAVGWAPEKPGWQRAADAGVLARCPIVTAVSSAMAAELRDAGLRRADLRIIPNGVRVSAGRPARLETARPVRRIGVMAQLVPRKGVDVAVRAAARLGGRLEALVVAGDGPMAPALVGLASTLEPSCRVDWIGPTATDEFLGSIDLLVVPSRSDALPMVLLQAMAAGVPVVATAVGGVPEAVTDGVEGLLVPPDDAGALAEAIGRAVADPAGAAARAARAHDRVKTEFSLARMIDRYFGCYAELARRGSGLEFLHELGQVVDVQTPDLTPPSTR